MSRFASKEIITIELDGGDKVEVRKGLPYEDFQSLFIGAEGKTDVEKGVSIALPLAELAVVGWDFKDDEGAEVPFSKEKIRELDFDTITTLSAKLLPMYMPEKKSSTS
jgi:hypothetical protein